MVVPEAAESVSLDVKEMSGGCAQLAAFSYLPMPE